MEFNQSIAEACSNAQFGGGECFNLGRARVVHGIACGTVRIAAVNHFLQITVTIAVTVPNRIEAQIWGKSFEGVGDEISVGIDGGFITQLGELER